MNRLNNLFVNKRELLSVYFTAGFPQLNDTVTVLQLLQEAGVDFVEIGMPFSDPLADGPVIQKSSSRALENGMTLKVLFRQLENVRKNVSMPIILMGYLNPVLKYGMEAFVNRCHDLEVDGVILPDLPFELYDEKYRHLFEEGNLSNILLVSPQTPAERIKRLDEKTTGFLYLVSSAAVTGTKSGLSTTQIEYFERISAMNLKSPIMVGFGISDHESFREVCKNANGAIVGSAFIRMIENSIDKPDDIRSFVRSIRNGDPLK